MVQLSDTKAEKCMVFIIQAPTVYALSYHHTQGVEVSTTL